MNVDLEPDQEKALKHFTDIPNRTILPARQTEQSGITKEQLQIAMDSFWAIREVKYHDAYQAGKMIATGQKKGFNATLLGIHTIIEEGIKRANMKADITSENLSDHFQILSSSLKVLASSLNALYARKNSKDNATIDIDYNELLAMLSGYIAAKVYGV